MRNLKKVLALVLAFSMMLSVVAFASYSDVSEDASYAGAVELLSSLNIIKGDDLGNFNPDATITRAEYAAIVCRALGLEESANGAKGITSFNDVSSDHWASGYINLATQNGIINGYGDGNFGPEDKVTYEQAVKMLVCALGFEPMAAQKGGYPTGYLVVANQYKITSGVNVTAEAPRSTVAQLVYNALSTPKMDQTSYGSDAKWEVLDGKGDREYATLLTDMDIFIATGVVGEKDGDSIDFTVTEDSDDFEFEKGDTPSFKINGSNIENYVHQNVDVYVQEDGRNYNVLAVVTNKTGETLTINSDDVKTVTAGDNTTSAKIEYYTDSSSKTKTIKVRNTVAYQYNKGTVTNTAVASIAELTADDIELQFVENTGDSEYDNLIATKYTSTRIDDVDAANDKITLDGVTVDFDFDDDNKTYVLEDDKGNTLKLADYAEDDVVAYFGDKTSVRNADYLKIVKLSNAAVTGKVTETATKKDTKYIYIDGKEYEVAKDCAVTNFKNDDEGTFFIGMTGKVIDFEGSAAGDNYGYVLEGATDKNFNETIWQVKLLTKKDGVVTYDLTDDASLAFAKYAYDTGLTTDVTYTGNKLNGTAGNVAFDTAVATAARLVTYKTNSKGEIKEIEAATADGGKYQDKFTDETYNDKTQSVKRFTLEDDAVVFDVSASKADSAYASDISALVDDGEYSGFVFTDDDNKNVVFVVTDGQAQLSNDTGFAIVTNVKSGSKDGEDITIVDYVMDGKEGTVTFDEDSEIVKGTKDIDFEDLDIGDVIMFNANSESIVNTYAVLGQVGTDGLFNVYTDTLKKFDEDNEFYYGYIANTKRENKGKGETIYLGGKNHTLANADMISVLTSTNKYSYNDGNSRNIEIENGAFINNDAYYYLNGLDKDNKADTTKDEATFVFVRIINGSVSDIYSFNQRVVGKTAIDAEAENAVYVDCDKADENKVTTFGVEETVEVVEPVAEETVEKTVETADDAVIEEKDIDKVELD